MEFSRSAFMLLISGYVAASQVGVPRWAGQMWGQEK